MPTKPRKASSFPVTNVFSHIEVADGRIWLKPAGIGYFAGDLPEAEELAATADRFLMDKRETITVSLSRSPVVVRCLLMAQSGHPTVARECPLLGVKRTWRVQSLMSAFDPKRTLAANATLLIKLNE